MYFIRKLIKFKRHGHHGVKHKTKENLFEPWKQT